MLFLKQVTINNPKPIEMLIQQSQSGSCRRVTTNFDLYGYFPIFWASTLILIWYDSPGEVFSTFYLRQHHTPNLCIFSDSSSAERFHVQGTSILSHNILFPVPTLCHQQCRLFWCICVTWHRSMASFNLQSGAPETAASRSYLHATVSWLLGWFGLVCWSAPVLSSCPFLLCEESTLLPTLGVRHCMVHWCLFHRAQHRPAPCFDCCLLGPCDVSISPWWEVFLPCVHMSPLGHSLRWFSTCTCHASPVFRFDLAFLSQFFFDLA
jgi:hypothetical protein